MGHRTWNFIGLLVAAYLYLANCLQVQNVCTTNCSADPTSWVPIEECDRECDGTPKNCYMKMHVERYQVMGPACGRCGAGEREDCLREQCITADGFPRAVVTVNRKYPSPIIAVCKGDTLAVDVQNQMADLTTSIHWHGLDQRGTPYSDGVPFVTQCPIGPANSHRYIFKANQEGTFFYHSHTGVQKLDGLSGPLIVRGEKSKELYSHLYDEDLTEHVLFITDWTHVPGEHLSANLHIRRIKQAPVTFLINGKGKYFKEPSEVDLPITEVKVESGKSYRLRVIGGTCLMCAAEFSIEGHNMLAIAADGGLTIQPTLAKSILFAPADRFDVILNATQPGGVYKINVTGVGPGCDGLTQSAILRYTNSAQQTPSTNHNLEKGYVLNLNVDSPHCSSSSGDGLCISQLNGTTNAPRIMDPDLYSQIELGFGFYTLNPDKLFNNDKYFPYDEPVYNSFVRMEINKITFKFPSKPLLSQGDDIPPDALCSEACMRGNVSTLCACPALYKVKLNSVVDLIVTDLDEIMAHPFHLHGFNFYVLEMGGAANLTAKVEDLKKKLRNDEISMENKPMKDTVSIPFGGYAVLRFYADNPGFWIFHCHFAFHLENGMAAVLGVGERSDLPPVPPNFPKCGNYLPSL